MRIILGSSSKSKKQVLLNAGYTFEVMVPSIDTKLYRNPDPYELANSLARAKAKSILQFLGDQSAVIIVSDQLVLHMNLVRDKPENYRQAYDFLSTCHKGTQIVVTAVCVIDTKTKIFLTDIDVATIEFEEIPDSVILKYLGTSDTFFRVGGFNHRHRLLKPYIKNIRGSDDSLIGMPLGVISNLLKKVKNSAQ